ncbi:MAG: hypothetical protein IH940_08835 [Acidobacteria bacterium]|nr:hypothetical protein [Acidobacteriota bacterium]
MIRRGRRPTAAFALCAIFFGWTLGAGRAATLGGVSSGTLISSDSSSTPNTPTIEACDNFSGSNGESMSGRTVVDSVACSDRVWTSHSGTWSIKANKGASTSTSPAVVTVGTEFQNGTTRVDVSNVNTGSRLGGLVASHDGTSTYLAAVMINDSPDRVELVIVVDGTSTVIATSNPTFAATNRLVLTRFGAAVAVSLNSTTTINTTLSASQVTSLGSGGRSGLFGGHQSVQFDDFVATK